MHYSTEFSLAQRRLQPLSVIVIDFDHFKRINDDYGHLAGDRVLKTICNAIADSCRAGETLARVGGEEFCVVLSQCDKPRAFIVAERIRQAIKAARTPLEGQDDIRMTASLGVACSSDYTDNQLELYRAADSDMYRAKQQGRSRVVG